MTRWFICSYEPSFLALLAMEALTKSFIYGLWNMKNITKSEPVGGSKEVDGRRLFISHFPEICAGVSQIGNS
jgi:hypothetical protein